MAAPKNVFNGPMDLDVLELLLAPLPPALAESYRKALFPSDHFSSEEGHSNPGGFGV